MNTNYLAKSIAVCATLLWATPAAAATVTAGPADDVESIINGLMPGDELVLADGTYTLDGSRFGIDIAGTEAMPIVIRSADGARAHFNRPTDAQNIWDINAAYVVFRGIEFSGGSAGLRFEAGRFVTVQDCEIHDTGDVALRMNDGGRYEGMRILHNEIHHTNGTGEGMYLGCNSNGCQVANSLIEGNYVHHTNQATVDQGDGIELKEGSFGNIIRGNVIHDTNYPCILTYSTVGNGAANIIENNALWNCGDHGIQSAADAIIRNNIILGAVADGIAMQPHQAGTPSNLIVVHNTVLNSGTAISLRGATGTVLIANNALYSETGEALFTNGSTSLLTSVGNVGVGGGVGVAAGSLTTDFVMANFGGAPPMNVFPAAGSALVGAGVVVHVTELDFDYTARAGVADVGAYAFASGAPGWVLGEGFKGGIPGPGPSMDGGVPMPTDGGVPPVGTDGGRPAGDAGVAPVAPDEGGCSCRASAGESGTASSLAGVFVVLLALGAMRRRRA